MIFVCRKEQMNVTNTYNAECGANHARQHIRPALARTAAVAGLADGVAAAKRRRQTQADARDSRAYARAQAAVARKPALARQDGAAVKAHARLHTLETVVVDQAAQVDNLQAGITVDEVHKVVTVHDNLVVPTGGILQAGDIADVEGDLQECKNAISDLKTGEIASGVWDGVQSAWDLWQSAQPYAQLNTEIDPTEEAVKVPPLTLWPAGTFEANASHERIERLRGRVGINQTEPSRELDVSGDARVTGTATLGDDVALYTTVDGVQTLMNPTQAVAYLGPHAVVTVEGEVSAPKLQTELAKVGTDAAVYQTVDGQQVLMNPTQAVMQAGLNMSVDVEGTLDTTKVRAQDVIAARVCGAEVARVANAAVGACGTRRVPGLAAAAKTACDAMRKPPVVLHKTGDAATMRRMASLAQRQPRALQMGGPKPALSHLVELAREARRATSTPHHSSRVSAATLSRIAALGREGNRAQWQLMASRIAAGALNRIVALAQAGGAEAPTAHAPMRPTRMTATQLNRALARTRPMRTTCTRDWGRDLAKARARLTALEGGAVNSIAAPLVYCNNQSTEAGGTGLSLIGQTAGGYYGVYLARSGNASAKSFDGVNVPCVHPALTGMTSFCTRFRVRNLAAQGWVWEGAGTTTATADVAVAALDGTGNFAVSGTITAPSTLNLGTLNSQGLNQGISFTNSGTNFATYVAQSGAARSFAGGTACAGGAGAGMTNYAARMRVGALATNGFIVENTSEACCFSVGGNGTTYAAGALTAGGACSAAAFTTTGTVTAGALSVTDRNFTYKEYRYLGTDWPATAYLYANGTAAIGSNYNVRLASTCSFVAKAAYVRVRVNGWVSIAAATGDDYIFHKAVLGTNSGGTTFKNPVWGDAANGYYVHGATNDVGRGDQINSEGLYSVTAGTTYWPAVRLESGTDDTIVFHAIMVEIEHMSTLT